MTLIAGERDRVRARRVGADPDATEDRRLRLSLEGGFEDHHAMLLWMHLDHVDNLNAGIDRLDAASTRDAPVRHAAGPAHDDPRDREADR